MTVQSAIRQAELLLNCEEGDAALPALRTKLLNALDTALCELARVFPVQARCRVDLVEGEAPLPPRALVPRGLYQKGKRVPMVIQEGKLVGEDGTYTLVYYRTPPKASEGTPAMQLPYPEDLCAAVPFYCAAVCVMAEDPAFYARLMEQYNTKLSAALGYRPAAAVEGGGCL